MSKNRHLESPIFIIGAARSGTSLLYKTLCLNRSVAYISNWVARYPATPQLAALNRLASRMPEARRRVWFSGGSNAYVYGSRRPSRDRMFPMPVEGEPVYLRCGIDQLSDSGHDIDDDKIRRLRGAFSSIARYAGAPIFVNKRIANNRRIPLLRAAFPDARFVEIIRDGRAVALSLSRVDWWPESVVWWYGGSPQEWEAEGRDPWEICARNWVEELVEIERGKSAVEDSMVLTLRYESFVADPHGTLDEIASFIGVGKDSGWEREVAQLSFPPKAESWRETLAPEALELIASIQQEKLEALGYRS